MVNFLRRLWNRLTDVRRKPEKKEEPQSHISPLSVREKLERIEDREREVRVEKIRKEFLPKPQTRRRRIPRRTSRRRPHHDISKFMKGHGRWSPEYKRSVEAGIQPEDD